jgi:catechol 2,3-dioxygenase-like lactoylglutathione lyase family enzyme
MSTGLEITMYDHIGLKVSDLDASIRFYTAALAPLGYVLCSPDETGAGFGPKDAPALWLYRQPERKSADAHIAFRAPDHDATRNSTPQG